MNIAILVITLFTLLYSAKWVRKTLSLGDPTKEIEKRQKQLDDFKKLIEESGKTVFVVAWLISLLVSSSFLATAIYVLTQTLTFNLN